MKPLSHYVVLRERAQDDIVEGIYIPTDTDREAMDEAVVVAVGPDVVGLKVDDRVIFKPHAFDKVKVDKSIKIGKKVEEVLIGLDHNVMVVL